jgi:hypothetical protein
MEPIKHYEVLASVEIEGTLHDVGAVIELPESIAAPFVNDGLLKEHGTGSAPVDPAVPPQNEPGGAANVPEAPVPPAAPEAPQNEVPAAPEPAKAPEEPKGWVGNHTVAGNEPNPHKGGGLRDPHPDLSKKA